MSMPAETLAGGISTQMTDKFGNCQAQPPPSSNGSSGRHTFTEAGTYDYLCSVHESMTGQIVVN